MNWNGLLNDVRRKDKSKGKTASTAKSESRTEIERDYDRILFSAPVRRLADKTQVFPLEINDSVRTRLTHSHEVSNLSRSIGVELVFNNEIVPEELCPKRNVPALLAAIGLAHDLGNPPFGHQGENAIRTWFRNNEADIFSGPELSQAMKNDFLNFEGNAQTLRLVTKLQIIDDDYGLNLTYGTLAALLKYTVPSDKISEDFSSRKKYGFFQSEKDIVNEVWQETGLSEGVRHPLTYIMEACDDIAYSVLDAEDSVKKQLVSFSDLISHLKHQGNSDKIIKEVCIEAEEKHNSFRSGTLSPSELNDVSMQMFRVYAIKAMVRATVDTFSENLTNILDGTFDSDLIKKGEAKTLCKSLKNFDRAHGYNHKSVLALELQGYNTIIWLMDILWNSIIRREYADNPGSKRTDPLSAYVYGRISENYRRIFESEKNPMPIRYREAQLLTDMISGMTDNYAINLYKDLKKIIS